MHPTSLKSFALLAAALVLGAGLTALAQTAPTDSGTAPVPLTMMAPRDQWQFQFSGDLFSFDSDYSQEVNGFEYESDRHGDLYGGALGIKWPGMSEGSWLELVYRAGDLDGNQYYNEFDLPPQTDFHSDMTQFGVALKGESGVRKNKDGVPNQRWVWSVGYSFTQWETTETAPPDFIWFATGTRYLEDTTTFHLLEVTGGYSWAPLALRTGDNSFFRLGPRLEGVLGVGASVLDSDWHEDDVQIAFNFGGRALVFADLTIRNVTIGAEGGYQYIQYYSLIANDYYWDNDNFSEAMSGFIGRVQCSVHF